MADEVVELLDTAIYKEISSQAFYIAGQAKTEDQGARKLLQELALAEQGHAERLKKFKEAGWEKLRWRREKMSNLLLSDYLIERDDLEGAGLQDVLLFAVKREQQSVEFYSRMTGIIADKVARKLCQQLVHDELRHKLRLETFYDDLFYQED